MNLLLRQLSNHLARVRAIRKRHNERRNNDVSRRVDSAEDSEYDPYFEYTSGRWIYNEQKQIRIRHASFDVNALKRIAATAGGAERCIEMNKIAEGSFNKIFLLTLDNGTKLIAKIPCPLVAPRQLCTASEVATMDYARTILGLPVPRVLSWSKDADASDVQSEYILMENVQGVEVHKRMSTFKREATYFVDRLVDVECTFVRRRFSQIGSLYYKEDVDPELQQRPLYAEGEELERDGSNRFRIGPCVNWDIWRGERSSLDVDHGPWPDTLSYIKAIVNIEKEWLSKFAVPRTSRDVFRRPGDENVPDAHIRLLDKFLAVIPHILPPDELSIPVLWHTDLHGSNVFVTPEGQPDIVGLIDWQGISVLPLFIQATFAACVEYDGDDRITISPGVSAPTLPPDFDALSDQDKTYLKDQERLAIIHKYYETRVSQRNPLHVASQTYPHMRLIVPPILSASRTWHEGMYRLRQVLVEMQDVWGEMVPGGMAFPVVWGINELKKHQKSYPRLTAYEERVETLARGLQLEGDGWVTNERYDEVMQKNKKFVKGWRARALGGPYPFQDGGYSWFLS